jgi:hypothetical protein
VGLLLAIGVLIFVFGKRAARGAETIT